MSDKESDTGNALRRLARHRVVADFLAGEGLPRRLHLLLGLVLPMWILCVNMWRVHRFTVDDSYISFRYAVNLADGHGLDMPLGQLARSLLEDTIAAHGADADMCAVALSYEDRTGARIRPAD